ncbi:hypothetical protein OG874_39665 [Nocardia sp. NBC_00565]|uniref:hypothetical protein n=1 Tax=Nocardia sp. NBC_00565 TaxID=2975993 RepID=UPI002E803ACE|nr:hypothetical protein [Nocardia sp. NBC_00565]WUC02754.1 hypothetical protein OG874_39665 [Nocardia sp. NBC_00565]
MSPSFELPPGLAAQPMWGILVYRERPCVWVGIEVPTISADLLRVARKVQNRYMAVRLDLTDATNVSLAERYETVEVLTLDRRDFRAVTPLTGHAAFRLLPDDL